MSGQMMERNKVMQFAATPVLLQNAITGHEEMNRKLIQHILAMREKTPAELRTNVGGWQSPTTFLETLPEELRLEFVGIVWGAICDIVASTGTQLQNYRPRMMGWANVSMKGALNLPHIHPNGAWSAVYYLAGDAGAGGGLHLMDH